MDLGKQGGGKNPRQLLLPLFRELRRKVYCAQHVRYNNGANICPGVFLSQHTDSRFERRKSQWEDLKDSLKNSCIVREAITPLQMWGKKKKRKKRN